MAKCLVLNTLGSTTKSFSLPASDTNAMSICEKYLGGKYEVFALTSSVGADTDIAAFDASVQVSDSTTGRKTYLNFIMKDDKNEGDVRNALMGKIIDGIKIDTVVVIKLRYLYGCLIGGSPD